MTGKKVLLAGIIALMVNPVAQAASDKHYQEQKDKAAAVGLGTGVVIGAIVAGPIGAGVAGILGAVIGDSKATSEQLKEILPPELNSLVKSPCHCRVVTSLKSDREFAKQGDLLFQVAALDAQPYVTAYFSFKDAEHITQNSIVHITIPGDKTRYTGLITNVVVSDNDKRPDSIIATIVPQQPLDISSIARPVNVSIGEFFSYSDVDFSAIAKEFGTTIE